MASKSKEGITLLESKLLPFAFEKVLGLIQAHRTSYSSIHPHAKSVRQEGEVFVAEEECDLGGANIKVQVKFTVDPDLIAVEFCNGPAIGSVLTKYGPFEGGTRVISESNFSSEGLDDDQLAEFIQKYVDRNYDDNLRYLNSLQDT